MDALRYLIVGLGFPRPHRRGRIETLLMVLFHRQRGVSPGLTAGGGLKHLDRQPAPLRRRVSPGLTAGGGLKLAETSCPR